MRVSLKARVIGICVVLAAALAGLTVWLMMQLAARGGQFLAHPVLFSDVMLVLAIFGTSVLTAFFILAIYLEASGRG